MDCLLWKHGGYKILPFRTDPPDKHTWSGKGKKKKEERLVEWVQVLSRQNLYCLSNTQNRFCHILYLHDLNYMRLFYRPNANEK